MLLSFDFVQDMLPIPSLEEDGGAEYQMAFELAMKKYNTMSRLAPDVQVRRIQSLLQRKGFSFGVIGRVLRELGIEVKY